MWTIVNMWYSEDFGGKSIRSVLIGQEKIWVSLSPTDSRLSLRSGVGGEMLYDKCSMIQSVPRPKEAIRMKHPFCWTATCLKAPEGQAFKVWRLICWTTMPGNSQSNPHHITVCLRLQTKSYSESLLSRSRETNPLSTSDTEYFQGTSIKSGLLWWLSR